MEVGSALAGSNNDQAIVIKLVKNCDYIQTSHEHEHTHA